MSYSVSHFILVLEYMTLFFIAFSPFQDFRKSINSLVDEVIWIFFMSISYFKMVFPKVDVNNAFGIMFPFTIEAKIE